MRRWTDVSTEPNSDKAKLLRIETLKAARRAPVKDRNAYLQSVAAGKRVLDVGVVAHTIDTLATSSWLHRAIAKSAAYCLGVDILEEDVKKLREAGYNVRCADITQDPPADLGQPFEVVVVGEVIEHLGSPEKLFAAAKRLLAPGGRMVLTTPNPYYWKRMRNATWRWYQKSESVDHVTLLFPSGMAEFAERAGLELESYRGVLMQRERRPMEGAITATKKILAATLVQAEIFCETIVYECRLPE